jgi:hypothetical protein
MHEPERGLSPLAGAISGLEAAGIAYALIGAAALAVHGISRSTLDVDLFAVDRSCLARRFWAALEHQGIEVEIRQGDADDPLLGVVRFSAATARPVDLVIGRLSWQRDTLARAGRGWVGNLEVPVLRPADLVLLKLYAGGPQDAWDIAQLLFVADRQTLVREVEGHLAALPAAAVSLWRRIAGDAGEAGEAGDNPSR